MAVVDCAIAVGSAVGLEGGAALIGGGAIMGAGAGALYSGITGDGNILNSALNGALLGGGAGALGAAAGLGATAAAAPELATAGVGAVAPTAGVGAPVIGSAAAPTGDAIAGMNALNGWTGTAANVLPDVSTAATAASPVSGMSAAQYDALINTPIGGTPSFWDSSAGTAAKWGAGLMAANSIIGNSNKKYGTLSPSQTTSLPLQYQSNFGTYKPLDTSVMRPMGTPAGYNGTPYGAPGYIGSQVGYAAGGIADANPVGNPSVGPVEQMSRDNALGQNQMFPQANINSPAFSSATNTPMGTNMIAAAGDTNVDPYSGAEKFAGGGAVQHYDLGGFIQNAAELPMNQFQTAMDNPGQALIGANTPFETNVWNSVTGSHMAPTTDMYGVPTGAHRPRYAAGGVARFSGGGDAQSDPYAIITKYIDDAKSSSAGMRQLTNDVQANIPSALLAYNLLKQDQKIQPGMSQVQNSANVQNPIMAQQASPTQSGLAMAAGGMAGTSSLGSYAAGGNPRLLKGPGDGMSDNIPAQIGASQPARLADGEFVVPADVVSHLGNGSTDAGAKRLHSMMDNVRKARTGRKAQGKQIKADKFVPK